MQEAIERLSDQQAVRAVRFFYDLSSPEIWEGGHKPSEERVKTIAAGLKEEAPADLQPIVAALLGDAQEGDPVARAAICRTLLDQLSQSPRLKPYVDQAVAKAQETHMAIDPVTGAFIITLLLASTKVETKPDGSKVWVPGGGIADVISALRLPELLAKLPAVLNALPTGALNRLMAKVGLG